MLIALGVLFLIDQAGGLSFHRSWPMLLVLYGVLKLAERLIAPPPPAPWQAMPPQAHWAPPPAAPPTQPPPPFGGTPQ
jgi:hypothetical protein